MNKTDYLVKKGQIADPKNGEMFVIHSTREGVTMKKIPVWEARPFGGRTKYIFNEAPYELKIIDGDEFGEYEGYGSGFGDLWAYSYFGTFDEAVAKFLFSEETKRVTDKYLSGKNNEPEYIPAYG